MNTILCGAGLFLLSGSVSLHGWGSDFFEKLETQRNGFFEKLEAQQRQFFKTMDSFWDDGEGDTIEKKEPTDSKMTILDKEAVKLPSIAIETGSKGSAPRLVVSDLKGIKKSEISVQVDEDRNEVQITFPYASATVTLNIYPRRYSMSAEKKLVREKKDEKGAVLASSSYVGYNSISKTFPFKVNVTSITPQFKHATLTLGFTAYDIKRVVAVK